MSFSSLTTLRFARLRWKVIRLGSFARFCGGARPVCHSDGMCQVL